MNRYFESDFENALECMTRMKYSQKAVNLFIYSEWWLQLDMFDDFERNPDMGENRFIQKYRKIYMIETFKLNNNMQKR